VEWNRKGALDDLFLIVLIPSDIQKNINGGAWIFRLKNKESTYVLDTLFPVFVNHQTFFVERTGDGLHW
jgi:hypothetical protein